MNLFQMLFLDVVLLLFPILVYLIYLSTNRFIADKSKRNYLRLALVTSFFMLYDYGIANAQLVPILIISSIVLIAYLEDLYIFANIFLIFITIIYSFTFNNTIFLLIGYIFCGLLYILKKRNKIKNNIFIEFSIVINSIVYYLWIYIYNPEYFNKVFLTYTVVCYFFIINIICLMYEIGKKILETHMDYKELLEEKQIRLSLFKITHEIKNPIAVCKGYLDMLNTNDKEQTQRYIPIIKSEIERLLTLLQDFLLINKTNLDLDIMDFNMLIEDTLKKLSPLLKENNINLKLDIIDDEIFVNGDYNRLSQVLINIIKNSIEAIPEDTKGEINIHTKIKNNNYFVYIEDNGIGMNREVLSKMKEPFFTTKKRGSGLGVSLIYEIIEAHNGKINYSSEYGKGTCVSIQIPIYE